MPQLTHRSPDRGFASVGAVQQSGGSLPIYVCNTCHRDVVWVLSTRTQRRYRANVYQGRNGARFYVGSSLHRCSQDLDQAALAETQVAIAERFALSLEGAGTVQRIVSTMSLAQVERVLPHETEEPMSLYYAHAATLLTESVERAEEQRAADEQARVERLVRPQPMEEMRDDEEPTSRYTADGRGGWVEAPYMRQGEFTPIGQAPLRDTPEAFTRMPRSRPVGTGRTSATRSHRSPAQSEVDARLTQ